MSLRNIPFVHRPAKQGRPGSITMTVDGKPVTLSSDAVNFNALLEALKNGAWSAALNLISVKKVVAAFTNGLVQIIGNEVIHDGKPVHSALTTRILELMTSNGDLKPLTNFLNNLMLNPSESARDELYLFLGACNLPITDDGHFLAYKVVNSNYKDKHTGTMDNSVGATPKMDRALCNPNRYETCSRGLHFCSRSYISTFMGGGDHLMVVKVNPRDVVSIPSDYNNAKGRACEYLILEELSEGKVITPGYRATNGENVDGDLSDDADDTATIEGTIYTDRFVNKALDSVSKIATANDRKITATAAKSKAASGVKLDAEAVLKIRKLLKQGFKYSVIGAEFGVHRRTIERIDNGTAWTEVKEPAPQAKKKPAKKKVAPAKPSKGGKSKVKPKRKR